MIGKTPRLRQRRSGHLPDYDYSLPGAYFVTTCTHNREQMFGMVDNGRMILNRLGEVVQRCWHDLPYYYPSVQLDAFVVMPNHVHGIIILTDVESRASVGAGLHGARPTNGLSPMGPDTRTNATRTRPAPTVGDAGRVSLREVVRALKSFSAIRINGIRNSRGVPVWQRGYHDHVIRTDADLKDIRLYIQNNPLRWSLDPDNPDSMVDTHETDQYQTTRG